MQRFRITRLQASIFTPDLNITSSLKFLNFIDESLGSVLDGNPSSLPIPQDAPADIPRIQASSADDKWKLNLSLARTDLFYVNPFIHEAEILEEKDFSKIVADFFSEFQEHFDLRVQRLAFVTDRASEINNPSRYIVDNFCKEELKQEGRPFDNVGQFEIHTLKKYQWLNYKINSWVRIRSTGLKAETIIPIVLFTNDLNTLSSDEDSDKQFDSPEIKKFFANIPKHLNEILTKYSLE